VITLPITEQAKQQEWSTILQTAKNNGFPSHIIHNLRNELITNTKYTSTTQTQKKMGYIHLSEYTYI